MKVIIVDDEWAAGHWLGSQLEELEDIEILDIIQDPRLLIEIIRQYSIDAVFLDISMPEFTGLELADQLIKMNNPPEVVFVTAYVEHALTAFKVNALDYIVKPAHRNELQRVVNKINTVRVQKNLNRQMTEEKDGNHYYSFDVSDFITSKCEELYYLLVLKDTKILNKWFVIEALWPETSPEKGDSNLRTTVFRLNQTFKRKGLSIRVKGIKEAYGFFDSENSKNPIQISLFSPIDLCVVKEEISIVNFLDKNNIMKRLENKDYSWLHGTALIENYFIRWAMKVLDKVCKNDQNYLYGLMYLVCEFPWNIDIALRAKALVLRLNSQNIKKQDFDQQIMQLRELQKQEFYTEVDELLKTFKSM